MTTHLGKRLDNNKLAKAIAAILALTESQDELWTDDDDTVQELAFQLWEWSDAHPGEMVRLLMAEGLDLNVAADFCDVDSSEYKQIEREAKSQGWGTDPEWKYAPSNPDVDEEMMQLSLSGGLF